jgi:hypothetical protein
MRGEKITVIMPVHNEEKVLENNVRRLEMMMEGLFRDFEILISEDGSTDSTVMIAKSMESDRIRVFNNLRRQGKGAAIKSAAKSAAGGIIIFMDADLASDPAHVKELVRILRQGSAIVVGSRYLAESRSRRKPVRLIASMSFNWLVRTLLGSKLTDHQCGFKAFRKDLVLPVVDEIEDGKWFWDAELLVRAQRKGLKVSEIPIRWNEAQDSKFNLLNDTWNMAGSLVRFKLKYG